MTEGNDTTALVGREPKRSDEYLQLLTQLKESFTAPVDIANRLFEQGKKEGLSNDLIRKDIESVLAGVIKERRLREILPLELKRKYTLGNNDDSALSAELHEPIAPDTVSHSHMMEAFKTDIHNNETIWKAKILQMGKELDVANKIPKERIASHILHELRDVINKESTFTSGFVLDSLPAEYKLREDVAEENSKQTQPRYWPARFTFHDSYKDFYNCFVALLNEISPYGDDINKITSMPLRRLVQESGGWQVSMLKTCSDDEIYITLKPLIPVAALLMAFAERMEEEAKIRRKHSKDGLFSP